MEPKENVVGVCKECSDKRREEFQKTLTVFDFQRIESLVKQRKKVYVKVVFSEYQEKYCNELTGTYFSCNMYCDDLEQKTEHMWVLCGDVDLEKKCICGILDNDPFVLDSLRYQDIVVFSFNHIEDIIYPPECMN